MWCSGSPWFSILGKVDVNDLAPVYISYFIPISFLLVQSVSLHWSFLCSLLKGGGVGEHLAFNPQIQVTFSHGAAFLSIP